MTAAQAEQDGAALARRLALLRLPVLPLQQAGVLRATAPGDWSPDPDAVGVGPDGDLLAVWSAYGERRRYGRRLVATDSGARQTVLEAAVRPTHVQPLPGGRILLVNSRMRGRWPNAQIWTASGVLERSGRLGDAIQHVLTTPAGRIWVGYFDEALFGPGELSQHMLVCYDDQLEATWRYPRTGELPLIYDCYALNVDGEDAVVCFLGTDMGIFHLVSVRAGITTDHGTSPVSGVHGLLVNGVNALLVGGYPPDFDVLTPVMLGTGASASGGELRRLTRPDGREVWHARRFCRGRVLYVFEHTTCAITTMDTPPTL
ncbi:hypothetical protein QLQ12_29675 [Actinoplanes sp. NEAU-A12]|uniref:Uncharacterized protein n=1 Tax=Actinoplanes sandaracinus TaxID=3045177 RepID=A0ABT6WST1_9ACTN|nr:hypothetical protein [Actinoplanes sandaracinus]MDI6102798.1 hypothetical protein [Actinoplanes sandaracinus]